MFKRILVPLDGSARAESALPVAARIARATGGSLLLAQVISPPPDYSGGLVMAPMLNEQTIEIEMSESTGYLKRIAAQLAGVETRVEVSFGTIARQLLITAETYGADLIVICSHGRTGFTRWALGSVARTLVHQSAVPVLVLRQGETPLPDVESTRPLRALVPLDGSQLAEAALNPAAQLVAALAAPGQGALHLTQVVKPYQTGTDEGFVSTLNEEMLQQVRMYLATTAQGLLATTSKLHLTNTSSVELESDVASAIVQIAEQGTPKRENGGVGRSDLIAISTHGRGGLERWVMGSVTERVLNATKLPVLVVRPKKGEQ